MWYVKSFTGSLCLCVSVLSLIYNAYFLYSVNGFYVLPIVSLLCLMNTTLHSPGCISTRAELPEDPSPKQTLLIDKFASAKHDNILQPPHAHYSYVLNQIIIDYDHFCVWVNNGIGLLNIRYFIQFIFWTMLTSFYTLFYILNHLYKCTNGIRSSCAWLYYHDAETTTNVILGLLFGIFTCSMFNTQIQNLTSGLTSVDKVKGVSGGRYRSIYRFFGSYSFVGWFLPTPNTTVLIKHGKKTVSKCAEVLKDNGIKIIYK